VGLRPSLRPNRRGIGLSSINAWPVNTTPVNGWFRGIELTVRPVAGELICVAAEDRTIYVSAEDMLIEAGCSDLSTVIQPEEMSYKIPPGRKSCT